MKVFTRILAFRILAVALLLGLSSGFRITPAATPGDWKITRHSAYPRLPATFPVRFHPPIEEHAL